MLSKQDIARIQTRLAALDLYHGAIDGIAGPLTKTAVETFQAARGLVADGVVGPKTMAALFPVAVETGAMKTNKAGIALIKSFEACRLHAYRDGGGIWTVGWGLTSAAGLIEVRPDTVITQKQADDYFVQSLAKYERAVFEALHRVPTENQFSALVSLCYNIGPGAFKGSSLVRYFNAGEIVKAADGFLAWDHDGGKVVKGLTRRRAAERDLFLKP